MSRNVKCSASYNEVKHGMITKTCNLRLRVWLHTNIGGSILSSLLVMAYGYITDYGSPPKKSLFTIFILLSPQSWLFLKSEGICLGGISFCWKIVGIFLRIKQLRRLNGSLRWESWKDQVLRTEVESHLHNLNSVSPLHIPTLKYHSFFSWHIPHFASKEFFAKCRKCWPMAGVWFLRILKRSTFW